MSHLQADAPPPTDRLRKAIMKIAHAKVMAEHIPDGVLFDVLDAVEDDLEELQAVLVRETGAAPPLSARGEPQQAVDPRALVFFLTRLVADAGKLLEALGEPVSHCPHRSVFHPAEGAEVCDDCGATGPFSLDLGEPVSSPPQERTKPGRIAIGGPGCYPFVKPPDAGRTPLDLEAIKAREAEATKGPWRAAYSEQEHRTGSLMCKDTCGNGDIPIRITQLKPSIDWPGTEGHVMCDRSSVDDVISETTDEHVVCCGGHDYDDCGFVSPSDAEFIAHARQDVPALIAEVERLRAALASAPQPQEKP